MTTRTEQKPIELDDFAALYEETMRRQQAAEFYFFSPEYWQAMIGALEEEIVRFDATLDDRLVASVLCLASRPWLHYHLGTTSAEGRQLGASNLLLYEAGAWAKENGFEIFHLGGGLGGREDSLFGFKRCFDPAGVREFWIGKAVHDEDAYRALAGESAGLTGYFPAYRVPGALSQTAGAPDRKQRTSPATVADVTTR